MSEKFERRLAKLTSEITAAAVAYEARWTLAGLRRVDPELGGRLDRQIAAWLEASREGDEDEIVAQGEALCRGYGRAFERMAEAGAGDDAYLVGRAGGLTVVVGPSIASAERVQEAVGADAVFLTPDEVAGLLGSLGGFSDIAAIKRAWPGVVALSAEDRVSA